MASWKFSVECPSCGHKQRVLQKLEDHMDTYLTTCAIEDGGCGGKFAYEARQSVIVGRAFVLQQKDEGRAPQ